MDDADTPFGLAHILLHRSTWSPTWYCYLEDLFVDPSHRGKGAGRALIEAVYREADAHQCTRTYWVTEETNATARALYDRMATKTPSSSIGDRLAHAATDGGEFNQAEAVRPQLTTRGRAWRWQCSAWHWHRRRI